MIWCWCPRLGVLSLGTMFSSMPPGVFSFPQSLSCIWFLSSPLKHSSGASIPLLNNLPVSLWLIVSLQTPQLSEPQSPHLVCFLRTPSHRPSPSSLPCAHSPPGPTGVFPLGLTVLQAFSAYRLGKVYRLWLGILSFH